MPRSRAALPAAGDAGAGLIAAPFLARRGALLIGVLALGWAGLHAWQSMPRRLEPTTSSAFGVVEARLPGVSAAELEVVLTDPVETELLRLPEVLGCRSETRDGLALIVAECAGEAARSGAAWTSIEDRLDRLREELADGFVGLQGPLLHRPSENLAEAIVTVAADDGAAVPPVERARALAERLRLSEAVDHVDLVGRPREQIVLTYEDGELADAGLTPLEFREAFRAQHVTAPGAYLHEGGAIAPIETVSRIRNEQELVQLPLRDPDDGDPVNLSRLLDVSREAVPPAVDHVFAEGRPALALAVYRAAGSDLADFAGSVRDAVAAARDASGTSVDVIVSQPEVVGEEMDRFGVNLGQSFVVILVLLLAVLGLRAGLAVAVVLPFVVLTSFVVLRAAGLGFDVVTLSSFILVLGLLVDNHIVMAERTHRLKQAGASHGSAVGQAGRELFGPLVAAAATTVFGFLPVVLTDDVIGEYVDGLFWVVLVTLAVSLVFCFAVTPLLLSRGAPRTTSRTARHTTAAEHAYRGLLERGFAMWLPMAVVVVALCATGFLMLRDADRIFFPASSRPLWLMEIQLEHGAEVERTEAVTRELDAWLREELAAEDGPLEHWVTFVGRSAPAFQASVPVREFVPHYAQTLLKLEPGRSADDLERGLREWMASRSDGACLRLRPVRLGAQLEWPIQVEIAGPEAQLAAAAETVRERLSSLGCENVSTDWEHPIRKLRVVPDREALASRDLTVADVTVAMHSVLHGLPLFELVDADVRTPVMLRAKVRRANSLEALSDAYVYPRKGDPALLYEVAEVVEASEHPVRARKDGVPCMTVRAEGENAEGALALELEVDDWLASLREEHPELTFEVAGLSAAAERANGALLDQVPWALLLVLLCLILQSRSVLDTALIVLTIPLSFTGVAVGLWLTGQPFSFMTLVGMTALAGIVVNNAIVLLASIRRRVEESGYSRDAVVESASHRLRPILLTSLCALASMAVLYASGGPMWRPLATAVMSGLVFSTALVLFVLPVMYGVALRMSRLGTAR